LKRHEDTIEENKNLIHTITKKNKIKNMITTMEEECAHFKTL